MTSLATSARALLGEPAHWVTTAKERPLRSVASPLTGEDMPAWPVCTPEDVELALQRARVAQQRWSATGVQARSAVIEAFAQLVGECEPKLLDLVQAENGKARAHAFEEVADVVMTARYYAKVAPRALRPRRVAGAVPGLTRTRVHHHPLGVVAVIAPWNYPFTLAASDAVAALMAGNAVVLKPDARTVLCALAAKALLAEAGLPEDVFQVVAGDGSELGGPLIEGADYLMFTGSTATGRLLAQQAAEQLIGFSAELGGKNAMLVLADAPLHRAVRGAVKAVTSNSGQLCISTERIYVEDAIWDRFVPAFVKAMGKVRVGADTGARTEMGPLISAGQLETVESHVEDARAKGAEVLTGGKRLPGIAPTAYAPTVLTGVTKEMTVWGEETFGPVASLYRVADAEEAITAANDTDYGLNASVWSSPARGAELATRIEAGTVNVNDGYAATWSSLAAPMGGRKDSGLGRRHGVEGLLKYTDAQTVATSLFMPIQAPPLLGEAGWAKVLRAFIKVTR